jgi:hypothetical protein
MPCDIVLQPGTPLKRFLVPEKLDDKELVTFKELLMSNSVQVDALAQLLIEKGLITEQEFFGKLKKVQLEYNRRKATKT